MNSFLLSLINWLSFVLNIYTHAIPYYFYITYNNWMYKTLYFGRNYSTDELFFLELSSLLALHVNNKLFIKRTKLHVSILNQRIKFDV